MKSYNVKFDVGDMVNFDGRDNPYDAKYNPWKVVGIYIGFNEKISYRLDSEIQSC